MSPTNRISDGILAALTAITGAGRGLVLVLDPDASCCRVVASRGFASRELESLAGRLPIALADLVYWRRVVGAGGATCLDLAGDAPNWAVRLGVAAHAAVPMLDEHGTLSGVAVLECAPPSASTLAAATQLGRALAIALAESAVAESRAAELAYQSTLLDIVREVDRPMELPQVLAAICRNTVKAFGCRQATVYFQSRRHRASLPIADYGTPPDVVARFVGGRYIRGNIPHEHEVGAGRTVVIDRREGTPAEDLTLLEQSDCAVLVMVPLRDDAATVRGMLTLGFAEPREPTATELRALEMVAHHASMAILRARLLHSTTEAARFRAAVSALAVELNAATNRNQAWEALCARGCELFGVDTAALFLRTGSDALVTAAALGELASTPDLTLALDDETSPIVRALQSGTVVVEKDRPRRDGAPPLERLRSLLAVPLLDGGATVGVLVFGALRPRLLRPTVVEEAPLLGALAAAVLRNLELTGRLQDSNQRLHHLSDLKDQFLANVSHDLRTPLNIIIGFAQLALEDTFGEPPAALREILDRMLASARQQLALVQDLLDVSRLEFHGLSVKLAPVALAPLFAELEFLATGLVRDKPVQVRLEPPADDVVAYADADRVRQVLTNLLANAAKFTDAGTICLRAVGDDAAVRIEVADTGIGIPSDQLGSIFEPFRQVEGDRATLGTGLGLAIAHRLAELMGGSLRVASTLDVGSTFTLTLPLAPTVGERRAAAHG